MRNLLGLLLIAGLCGCAMSQSTLVGLGGSRDDEAGCQSSAGFYSLPKTSIVVEVGKNSDAIFLKKVALDRRADPGKTYCLDYLASMTAEEGFAVQKSDRGLLAKITSNSKDQSAQILKDVAKAVFTVISQNPDFDPNLQSVRGLDLEDFSAELATAYHGEFDPFNAAQAAVVNAGLSKFGFCLMIENQGIAHRFSGIDAYCDNPLGGMPVEQVLQDAYHIERQASPIRDVRGILYRPRLPYMMYLFTKRNLKARGGWRLKASEAIHLENQSPILGIGIDRAFFAERKTTLTFDHGALLDVDIDKTSELAGFVQVPLYIAQGIVALPANIIQVKINNTNNNVTLINAQDQLIATQKQYNGTLADLNAAQGARAGRLPQKDPATGQRDASNVTDAGGATENQSAAPDAALAGCVRAQVGMTPEDAKVLCKCTASCVAGGNGTASECATSCAPARRN